MTGIATTTIPPLRFEWRLYQVTIEHQGHEFRYEATGPNGDIVTGSFQTDTEFDEAIEQIKSDINNRRAL